MCGILGGVGYDIPASAMEALRHRGPDGQGHVEFKVCGRRISLGHTRLAILDTSQAGRQPMQSRDGRWWITFNGEIYNHLELRRGLAGLFRGHSDTETLVELIARDGVTRTLAALNGMFAFAALDTVGEELYLVRDPFGIKPVYYTVSRETFSFSSEVRALSKGAGMSLRLGRHALETFLSLRYVPSPETLFEGVYRLAPGHVLSLPLNGNLDPKISSYIQPSQDRFEGSFAQAVSGYQEALSAAIRRQLLSDVPVGLLLSGGIDSALVGAMAAGLGQKLPCFTVGFGEGHPECEISAARDTASVLGLPFHPIEVSAESLRESLPYIVTSVEEPLATTSIMPMWYLAKAARERCTVVLTGQGTDEPWGGYRRYQVEILRKVLPFPAMWSLLYGAAANHALPEMLERGLRTLKVRDLGARVLEATALFNAMERRSLLGSADSGRSLERIRYWLDWLAPAKCDPVESMMRLDARMNLADDLLLYGDKITMAASLEARVPMLDIELVRYVESLPLAFRVGLRRTKIVHKAMAASYLPEKIVNRPKLGFQVPFGNWSRSLWREYVEDALLAPNAPWLDVVDRQAVTRIWSQHLRKLPDRSRQIFSLLIFSIWYKQFISVRASEK